MKKLFALLLALMMVLSLAACGGGDDDKTPSSDDKTPSSSQQQQQTSKPDESKPAGSQPSGEEKEPLVKNVGENIWIGSFEGLDIQWRTLAIDEENEKALLITEDVIGHWVFSSAVSEDVTWETSDIREWLNGTFYNGAFSEEQKAYILESEIVNSANPATGTESGADTVDRVFLLSYEEAQTYFPTGESMRANYNFPQEYMAYLAKMIAATPNLEMTEQEALDELNRYSTEEDYASMWWLRTSGNSLQTAAGVEFEWVSESLNQVWTLQGIRPAIWVNLYNEQAAPGEDTQGAATDDSQQTSSGEGGTVSDYAVGIDGVPAEWQKAIGSEMYGMEMTASGDYTAMFTAKFGGVSAEDFNALVAYFDTQTYTEKLGESDGYNCDWGQLQLAHNAGASEMSVSWLTK